MPGGRPKIRTEEHYREYRKSFYYENRKKAIDDACAWNKENSERRAEIRRKYAQSEKGKLSRLRYRRSRRSAHRLARPVWRNDIAIDAIYEKAGRLGLHVDHVVPLRHPLVCGLHVEHNLELINPKENQRKGNRWWPDMPHIEVIE